MNRGGPSPLAAGVGGLCPRCGRRGLFCRVATFAPNCRGCGLDFSGFDVGDGAAPFLIFLVGGIAVIGAVWLQLAREPAWWVHLAIWPPLVVTLTIAGLRVAKGMLAALAWRHRGSGGGGGAG